LEHCICVLLVYLTDIGCNITATEVTTPVVPFKNKIQYYQRKRSFLITSYFVKMENWIHIFKSTGVVLSCDRTTKKSYKKWSNYKFVIKHNYIIFVITYVVYFITCFLLALVIHLLAKPIQYIFTFFINGDKDLITFISHFDRQDIFVTRYFEQVHCQQKFNHPLNKR
jgi:hypothetical protein